MRNNKKIIGRLTLANDFFYAVSVIAFVYGIIKVIQ